MAEIPQWHIAGDWFDNCSCAVPCPCTFAPAPDNGFCESVLSGTFAKATTGMSSSTISALFGSATGRGDLWARQATGVAEHLLSELYEGFGFPNRPPLRSASPDEIAVRMVHRRVGRGDRPHHRGVDRPEPLYPVQARLVVDDRHPVAAHLAGANA
jgi:hypothetical protein